MGDKTQLVCNANDNNVQETKVIYTLHACWEKDKELTEIQRNQSNLLHEAMKVNTLMPSQKGVMNIF